jgi:hypothetical protein
MPKLMGVTQAKKRGTLTLHEYVARRTPQAVPSSKPTVTAGATAHPLAALHATIGNRAVARLLQANPGLVLQRKIDPNVPKGPNPTDYANEFHEYLLFLDSNKSLPPNQRLLYVSFGTPTIDDVFTVLTSYPDFRDQVAAAYQQRFQNDVTTDILRLSTEDVTDWLVSLFASKGPGDFPTPKENQGVA